MLHYDCFLGFLSLLNHECQILFTSQPFCPWCIISFIAATNKNVQKYTRAPDDYTNYSTYTNLFFHDYKVPSDINPFDSSLNVNPIPRGVVEHYNLHICDPKLIKRGKAQNQAFAVTPASVIAQENLLRKLRSKEKNEMLNGQNKPVPRFLYFKDHGHTSSKGNWEINRPVMVRAAGHDDKQKGRESKFFRCSVLDKIICPGMHLEMDITPQDLFELIRSIKGDHLPGRNSWEKFVGKFTGIYIHHTDDEGSYTTVNCFKQFPPPSTIYLIRKGLEERTGIKFLEPLYLLVYTYKESQQPAHVDLSTSVFVPNLPLGYIIHLPLCAEGMWLRIWERDGVV